MWNLLTDASLATLKKLSQEVIGVFFEWLQSPVLRAALAVLWLSLHKENFPLLADNLRSAAGTAGKQKWALILPSSARVSQVTYDTIIGVRYPELDNLKEDIICFNNYLQGTQSTQGGFLPIFWDAPSSYLHAATDIGSAVEWIRSCFTLSSDENGCLAVLHNRNKMVSTFGSSECVTQSDGTVLSRSVTSCAGMTAHLVLLAQTKVGFLSGGWSKPFHKLSPDEQQAQREEAYARATVAFILVLRGCV